MGDDKPLLDRWWFLVLGAIITVIANAAVVYFLLFIALPSLVRVCKAAWSNP